MPELDATTRRLLDEVGAAARQARHSRQWSQRRLARASGFDHSIIGRIERGKLAHLSFRTAVKVLLALGIEPQLRLLAPRVDDRPIRDRAHARCVAFAARRLERAGYEVATEVEVGSGRWRGFIDVMAIHPAQRLLLVLEVKSELRDIGEVDRQLATYVEAAWAAAAERGWRPRGVTGILAMLATSETDRRLVEHRRYLNRAFALRARELAELARGHPGAIPARGVRGLAMIDPASRRQHWLTASVIDGRRTPAPYADRAAYLAVAGHRAQPRTDGSMST